MITFDDNSLKTLDTIGGTHFLALCVRVAMNLEEDSCKLKISGFTVRELSSSFGISVNKVNRLINLAKEIGVILKFDVAGAEMFLYNPSIAYKGKVQPSYICNVIKTSYWTITLLQFQFYHEYFRNQLQPTFPMDQ